MAGKVLASKKYEELMHELLSTRDSSGEPTLFDDPEFPASMTSLFKDGRPPPTFRYRMEQIVWKRPHDLVNNPKFVVKDFNRHDIDQGELGDCWFLAAAVVMATSHEHEFERVVPRDQGFKPERYTGMFRFNFWWYGKWVEVIIDDCLPTVNGRLIYSSNIRRPNEFWPCLLEKAYAKLWGSYEHLDGGKMHDALLDMTGGITEIIDLRQKSDVSSKLYSLLYTSHEMETMMGGSIFLPNNVPEREIKMLNGLYRRHAYSITGFEQLSTGTGTVNLLRLRNPWGYGEWNGPWSDGSSQMSGLSQQLKKKLNYKNLNDGEFWMSFEDFVANFDELQLCHLQPDAYITELANNDGKQLWSETVYRDKWIRGVTAGGSGNYPYENLFWKNPQFYVTLVSPNTALGDGSGCTLLVSLMKKEQENESRIAIGFHIYKLTTPLRRLEGSESALKKVGHIRFYSFYRQVTQRFELQPGTYAIIPTTFHPHEEASFMLRLFTERHIKSGVLDEVMEANLLAQAPKDHVPVPGMIERHFGSVKRLNAQELRSFLQDISAQEFHDSLMFYLESCRSLGTMIDEDQSGNFAVDEVWQALEKIKDYRNVFKQVDSDSGNTVQTYQLGTMLSKLGFPVSQGVLTSIARRYGGPNHHVTLPDFVMIACKLSFLFAFLRKQQETQEESEQETPEESEDEIEEIGEIGGENKEREGERDDDDEEQFPRINEFLLVTMFT